MYFTDKIELGKMENIQDPEGFTVPGLFRCERECFADRTGVARTEFYKALGTGIELTATFVVMIGEYHNEPVIRHNGILYGVKRAYPKKDRWILNCSNLAEQENAKK